MYSAVTSPTAEYMLSGNQKAPTKTLSKTGFKREVTNKHSTDIYWNASHCFLSVSLTEQQREMYDVPGAVPYVSLAKSQGSEWKSLRILTAECVHTSARLGPHTTPTYLVFLLVVTGSLRATMLLTSRLVGLLHDDHSDTSTYMCTHCQVKKRLQPFLP